MTPAKSNLFFGYRGARMQQPVMQISPL